MKKILSKWVQYCKNKPESNINDYYQIFECLSSINQKNTSTKNKEKKIFEYESLLKEIIDLKSKKEFLSLEKSKLLNYFNFYLKLIE